SQPGALGPALRARDVGEAPSACACLGKGARKTWAGMLSVRSRDSRTRLTEGASAVGPLTVQRGSRRFAPPARETLATGARSRPSEGPPEGWGTSPERAIGETHKSAVEETKPSPGSPPGSQDPCLRPRS